MERGRAKGGWLWAVKNDPIEIQMAAQTGTAEMAAPLRNLPRTPHLQLTLPHLPTVPPVPGSLMGTQWDQNIKDSRERAMGYKSARKLQLRALAPESIERSSGNWGRTIYSLCYQEPTSGRSWPAPLRATLPLLTQVFYSSAVCDLLKQHSP